MTSLSRQEVRDQTVALLDDTLHHALGLKETLEDERAALEVQDMDRIDSTVDAKSTCVQALMSLDRQRMELATACGFPPGPEQMPQLIEWCDESDLVKNRWDHLMIIAAESSAMNMTNGAIIRVRQQQFESSLSLLRGVVPGLKTYGRNGGDAGDLGRQSLAEA